jgi:hypothetical protein
MESVAGIPGVDEILDQFGQTPQSIRLYTQLCFCFSLTDTSPVSQSEVIGFLKTGLERLCVSFRWIAGQVLHHDSVFRIRPFEKTPILVVRNLRNELSTIDEFQDAEFPFSMLDERVLSQCNTFEADLKKPVPVLALQANFITGGLLLVFSGSHRCMDIAGESQVIHLFSKACCGKPFTSEELRTGHLPRQDIIPLLDEHTSKPQPALQVNAIPAPTITEDVPTLAPTTSPKSTWAYIIFSSTSLNTLKSLAAENVPPGGYVSTDDVLSAFIWQVVTQARLPRLDSRQESTFVRLVNVRKHVGIPATYTGNVVHNTSTSCTLRDLVEEPLGVIASRLRASLLPEEAVAYTFRTEATAYMHRVVAMAGVPSSAPRKKVQTMDIKLSSWAKERCYELDFGGVMRRPTAVRRTRFEGWEGLAYFMPKGLDGDIAAAVCLREEDLERVRTDERVRRWGRFVG